MRRSPASRISLAAVCYITWSFAGCGSPGSPSPSSTTTIPPTTSTTTTSTTSTSTTSTSSTSTSTTTSSIPSVVPFYGVYNVTFTKVRDDGCSIISAATGTLTLSGNSDGSNFVADVKQPSNGLQRTYRGTMRANGSFDGSGSGVTPGSVRPDDATPAHEYAGTIVGQVTGNNVSATENLKITIGCTGQPTVIYNLAGSK